MSEQLTNQKPKKPNDRCDDLAGTAERELTAFFGAVSQLFGREQAEASAEEWLKELSALERLPASNRALRSISTAITTRLARRLRAMAAAS